MLLIKLPPKSNTLSCSPKYHVPSGSALGPDLLPSCTAHIIYQISLQQSPCVRSFSHCFKITRVSPQDSLIFIWEDWKKTGEKPKNSPHILGCPKLGPHANPAPEKQRSPQGLCSLSSGNLHHAAAWSLQDTHLLDYTQEMLWVRLLPAKLPNIRWGQAYHMW